MKMYRKLPVPVGYVKSSEIFTDGTPIIIRTVEGDVETSASDNIYFMIGVAGEVYPISSEKFSQSYTLHDESPEVNFDYSPTVKNKITGESINLLEFAKSCVATGETKIFATPIEKNTKVFTKWDREGYICGKIGDYLAIRADETNDVYIIRKDIFEGTYVCCNYA
jgi:phosphoglycolate phosphatase